MPQAPTTALWLVHRDLRLRHNPTLVAAAKSQTLLPVYVHQPQDLTYPKRRAGDWWLHHSLAALRKSLQERGSDLWQTRLSLIKSVDTLNKKLTAPVTHIFYPQHLGDGAFLNGPLWDDLQQLEKTGVQVHSCGGNHLCSPEELSKDDGEAYQVFTPFWRNFLKVYQPRKPLGIPKLPPLPKGSAQLLKEPARLDLLPKISWDAQMKKHWQIGEAQAIKKLDQFVKRSIATYHEGRDIPSLSGTSQLSPHLAHGEIHPLTILTKLHQAFGAPHEIEDQGAENYCREILWREFSYHVLERFPDLTHTPLREAYRKFPWKENQKHYQAWCFGRTGYPIVDAGMRELYALGWMHNRVRMICASFLVKHLNIPWQQGYRWFWDTLVDADAANNAQGWQWSAGCGTDAAPYFRIFNPILQGKKFDKQGDYIRRWCPELKQLPTKWLFAPWEAPDDVLKQAGIKLGQQYPRPIVDHQKARQRALDNLASIS